MTEIGQQIIGAVRAVAAEHSAHVYPKGHCVYVGNDGLPACLLGHALWRLDLINSDLLSIPANDDGIDALFDSLDIVVDEPEMEWLEAVQGGQDAQSPWGSAVLFADHVDGDLLESVPW